MVIEGRGSGADVRRFERAGLGVGDRALFQDGRVTVRGASEIPFTYSRSRTRSKCESGVVRFRGTSVTPSSDNSETLTHSG